MDAVVLLANLRAHLERTPDFSLFSSESREHLIWLGQAHALILRYDAMAARELKAATDLLGMALMQSNSVTKIMATLHRAIADLELEIPQESPTAFDAHTPYDFFRQLGSLIESAESEVFIVDPYFDDTVFDSYVSARPIGVKMRLLLDKYAGPTRSAASLYNTQHGPVVEVRKSSKIHDRVLFIDRLAGWVIGQSLKDAAKAKPTYIAPLSPDVVSAKLRIYEGIWDDANAI